MAHITGFRQGRLAAHAIDFRSEDELDNVRWLLEGVAQGTIDVAPGLGAEITGKSKGAAAHVAQQLQIALDEWRRNGGDSHVNPADATRQEQLGGAPRRRR